LDVKQCKYRIFCLTDGEDNGSKKTYWEVAKYLQQNDIILDSVPVGGPNPNLHAMSLATGGYCLSVNDMEKGVALFEREAVLHINSRPANETPLPTDEASVRKLLNTTKLVEEIQSVPSQAVVNAPVMKKEDLDKVEITIQSTSTPAANTMKRILKEYRTLIDTPVEYWTPYVSADATLWKVIMEGPAGTPYQNGKWVLTISFPVNYPFKAPEVRFLIPIYHCNINNDGKICMDVLTNSWSPALTIGNIFKYITELLITPNPQDALDSVKANVYSDDRDTYNRLAKEHKEKHANQSLEELKTKFSLE